LLAPSPTQKALLLTEKLTYSSGGGWGEGNDTEIQALLDHKTNNTVNSPLANVWNDPECEYILYRCHAFIPAYEVLPQRRKKL
jgi:hypothetical protein